MANITLSQDLNPQLKELAEMFGDIIVSSGTTKRKFRGSEELKDVIAGRSLTVDETVQLGQFIQKNPELYYITAGAADLTVLPEEMKSALQEIAEAEAKLSKLKENLKNNFPQHQDSAARNEAGKQLMSEAMKAIGGKKLGPSLLAVISNFTDKFEEVAEQASQNGATEAEAE